MIRLSTYRVGALFAAVLLLIEAITPASADNSEFLFLRCNYSRWQYVKDGASVDPPGLLLDRTEKYRISLSNKQVSMKYTDGDHEEYKPPKYRWEVIAMDAGSIRVGFTLRVATNTRIWTIRDIDRTTGEAHGESARLKVDDDDGYVGKTTYIKYSDGSCRKDEPWPENKF
jgi:hypothetical protein